MDGSRIAQLRNKLRYSQQELAEQAGVSSHTVFRAEKGNDVNTHSMRAIARALNTSVAYLLGETETPTNEAAAKTENKNGTILKAKNREYDDIHINKWDNFHIRGRIVKIFAARDPRSVL